MQSPNIKIPETPNNLLIINNNFDQPSNLDTEEETVRHILSKKHGIIKQKMIKKLKAETPFLHKKQELCDLRTKLKTFIALKQENYEVNSGSSCEFTCPICLEMFLTPCPTSCGHMFCYRCIDESIIRRSTCPSCRSNIRNEEFVESKPFSKISDLEKLIEFSFWRTSKEKESYYDKRFRNEEWMKGRKINISNVKIEDLIDARDTEFIWCPAKIVNIFNTNGKIEFLVHFLGWNEIYDEIINSASQRLAPFKFFSSRDDIPKYRVNLEENNMRSRIDYPTSGDEESDSNNHVMVFEDNRENLRRNRFQLLNLNPDRRPFFESLITRSRRFAPDFSLWNGVQNLFVNLRPHRDQSSTSNNLADPNTGEQGERLNDNERADEEDEEEYEVLSELSNDEIDDDGNEIGQTNMNDSLNIPASNYYHLDEESVSNESALANPLNTRRGNESDEVRSQERESNDQEVIEVEHNNLGYLEANQAEREISNDLELQASSESSSPYSFGYASGEQ